MYQSAKVLDQKQITRDTYKVVLYAPEIAKLSTPGQFVMVKAWDAIDPFFMRPISLNGFDERSITLLYKVKGRGTKHMSEKTAVNSMTILGPLGHGFPMVEGKNIAVIGRGIGIAPLRPLVQQYLEKGATVYAYLSAKHSSDLFDRDYYEDNGVIVKTTVDNSKNITDEFIKDCESIKFDAAYSCGSKRLGRDMYEMHKKYGFPAYISLEEHMACGVGACKGCVCTAYDKETGAEHYDRVCQNGPVFDVDRVMK